MNKTAIIIIVIIIAGLVGITYVMTKNTDEVVPTPNATSTPPIVIVTPPVNQAKAPAVSIDAAAVPTNTTVVLSGSVRPNGAQTTFRYEYGKTNELGSKSQTQIVGSGFNVIPATGYITGLTPSTLYYYRLSATNSFGTTNTAVRTFTTSATQPPPQATDAPTASTIAATEIERTSATIGGNVNPRGSATSYWFEYGITNDLGLATSIKSAGSGTATQSVSVSINNLQADTKYFFRINAQNNFGTVNGSILSFTTDGPAVIAKPSVEVKAATAVAARSATVNGAMTPNGADTVYWFEYSTDSLIGSVLGTATAEKTIDGSSGKTDVNASLTGLAPSTTYNYRLASRNSQGTVRSEVMSFTTNGN
ncbi:MAG: hypothetical protein Q7R62_03590 [bacterium]|nr:hypothetical protein [bacterium]